MHATAAAAGMPIQPGFADPVLDAQACFRTLLSAMARPGRIETLDTLPATPPPLSPATTALALSLFDLETPVWIDRMDESAAQYLRFHCGCPIRADHRSAGFAIITDPAGAPTNGYRIGTPDYPDRSCTVILQVEGLAVTGADARLLSGPGIAETASLAVAGLPERWWQALAARRMLFPQGIDVILTTQDSLACLPRSTEIREADACM